MSRNSIKLYNDVPLDRVLLEGYGSYGTIYIKQGESVTLKVSADPSNANSWNEITFKDDRSAATSNITISNEKLTQAPGRPHRSPFVLCLERIISRCPNRLQIPVFHYVYRGTAFAQQSAAISDFSINW